MDLREVVDNARMEIRLTLLQDLDLAAGLQRMVGHAEAVPSAGVLSLAVEAGGSVETPTVFGSKAPSAVREALLEAMKAAELDARTDASVPFGLGDLTAREAPDAFRKLVAAGVRSAWFWTLPALAGGKLGVVALTSKTRAEPEVEEALVAQTLARVAALAIERDRTRCSLVAEERRYRGLFASATDWLLVLDLEARVVELNPAALAAFAAHGRDLDEVLGRRVLDYPWGGRRAEVKAALYESFERALAGEVVERELEIKDRTGQPIWVETRWSAVVGQAERPAFILLEVRDFSGWRRTEAALRASEKAHAEAQTLARLGHWDLDVADGSIAWSPGMYVVYDLPPHAKPPDYASWLAFTDPSERAHIDATVARGIREGTEFELHWRYRTPAGKLRHIFCRSKPVLDADGKVVRLIGTDQDVTAQREAELAARESEAQLRELYDSSPSGYFTARLSDGALVRTNRTLRELLAYSEEEIGHKLVQELFAEPREGAPAVRDLVSRVWRGDEVRDTELELKSSSGERIWVSLTVRRLLDAAGEPELASFMAVDVRERKRVEQERRQLEAQMRHAQKLESLGLIAGGVAHDFNNFLMAIVGNTDLAMAQLAPSSEAYHNLEEVTRASLRAADLCRQMLAYSGRGSFEIRSLDLSRLVAEMTDLLRISVPRSVTLECRLPKGLPPMRGDESQLPQVVMNLIVNASEAMERGRGSIRLTTGTAWVGATGLENSIGAELPPGEYLVLEVTDDGVGMSEATRERIFDPFFTTKFTGRGLGMAAVLGIVRGHGGAIQVESEPGRGSTFRVFFPVASEQAPEAQATPAPPPARATGAGTVILVDDETTVLELGSRMLEHLGFVVLSAISGELALEQFRAQRGTVIAVVLDLMMPGLSGEDVLTELRRERPDLPVLMTSGYTEFEIAGLLESDPNLGFLRKPYTLDSLAQALEERLAVTRPRPASGRATGPGLTR